MRNLLFALILITVGACSRWVANTGWHVPFPRDDRAYDAVVRVARANGYQIVERDPQRGFLKIASQLDGDTRVEAAGFYGARVVGRVSYISFQVVRGAIEVSVSGYHVRDGGERLHAKLDEEVAGLTRALGQVGGRAED